MRYFLIFSCFILHVVTVVAHQAEDNFFVGEVSLVLQNAGNYETFIIIRQKSLLSEDQMVPRSISLNINKSVCDTLIRNLIEGSGFTGSRFMIKSVSPDDITYRAVELATALIIITKSMLLLKPLASSGETDAMIIHFTLDDLVYIKKMLENNPAAYLDYTLDISDPVVLYDFSQLLFKACAQDGGIKLPPLIEIIELLATISERFSDKITV